MRLLCILKWLVYSRVSTIERYYIAFSAWRELLHTARLDIALLRLHQWKAFQELYNMLTSSEDAAGADATKADPQPAAVSLWEHPIAVFNKMPPPPMLPWDRQLAAASPPFHLLDAMMAHRDDMTAHHEAIAAHRDEFVAHERHREELATRDRHLEAMRMAEPFIEPRTANPNSFPHPSNVALQNWESRYDAFLPANRTTFLPANRQPNKSPSNSRSLSPTHHPEKMRNGDKKRGHTADLFSRLDTNGDGVLDRREFVAAFGHT